jgi:hypothetical protein
MTERSDRRMRELVRRGVELMRERRESEHVIADLAKRNPETIAKGLIVLTRVERGRLHSELRVGFGFTLSHGDVGYVCRFERSRPRTPGEAARWVDLFVHAVAFEGALRAMHAAAEYHPEPDRGHQVVNAFLDAIREAPGALYGALAEAGFEPAVREYGAAMLAAWTRSHLHSDLNPTLRRALRGEGWENELVNAAALAWADRDPAAPFERGTRFRDTLPRQADGRRRKAPGPPDLVNLTSRALEGREIGPEKTDEEPEEIVLASFADREKMLR